MIPSTLARPLAARVAGLPDADTLTPITTAFTDEGVLDAAEAALSAGKTHYTDRPGILPLREQISAYLAQLGLDLKPESITITCGVTEARCGQNSGHSGESLQNLATGNCHDVLLQKKLKSLNGVATPCWDVMLLF